MKRYIEPPRNTWKNITARAVMDVSLLKEKVQSILQDVRINGDDALHKYALKFDGVELDELLVDAAMIQNSDLALHNDLKLAIQQAARNIECFHATQLNPPQKIDTMPGVTCWRKTVGVEKVGIYIPGGTAPLFSTVLMLAIPARIAGCKQIILCTPPQNDGSVHPAILYAAKISGISTIAKVGGAQAIAAMAYGTETIPAVYKIFGPGNQYVTAAKMLIQEEGIPIDMPAGPSEVCVMADETAVPAFVAADLLSQAEHGADSQVMLVCYNEKLVNEIQAQVDLQLAQLPRKELAIAALANSSAVVLNDVNEAVDFINAYAAEHLIICTKNAELVAEKIINAGSIFIGNYSPESVGDYASGTNHTLPTNGFAAMYSGVSVDSFVKKITIQQLSKDGLDTIAPTVIAMAEAEGLEAHANAVRVRLKSW